MENNNELELMRSEMAELKQKLDAQEIVNDQLIRQSMRQNVSWITCFVKIEAFVLLPVAMLLLYPVIEFFHISVWWYVFTGVMMLADVVADWRINRLAPNAFEANNLVETGKRLQWMKSARIKQLYVTLPIFLPWLAWICYDMIQNLEDKVLAYAMSVGCIVGTIIGCCIGLYIVRRMQRTNDELIGQIESLTRGE